MRERIDGFITPRLRLLGTLAILGAAASNCSGQQGQAIPLRLAFAFGTQYATSHFVHTDQRAIEVLIARALVSACSQTLTPWGCDTGSGNPSLRVWIEVRNASWFLEVKLDHTPGRPDIQDHWEAPLLRPEDIQAQGGLPIDEKWVSLVVGVFKQLIAGTTRSGMDLLKALEVYAPLGKGVAAVSSSAFPLPGAVLPLNWEKYKDLSLCRFRIYYRDPNNILIALHSDGVGRSIDFNAASPAYQGLLVVHEKWQMGASDLEPIKDHVGDLPGLTPVEFYLEEFNTVPAGVALAR